MAIKGGQILHVAGAIQTTDVGVFVVDRIQTGGVTGINVNEDKIEELGNVVTVGTLRDIPDLTFEVESFDVSTEMESIVIGGDDTEAGGFKFDLAVTKPLDILSPYKSAGVFTVDDGSVVIPNLTLESVSYSMSLTDAMSTTWGFRGDSVYYVPGAAYRESFSGDGIVTVYSPANTMLQTVIGAQTFFALAVYVDGVKQKIVVDYTDDATDVTFLVAPPSGTDNIVIVYGSAVQDTFLQAVHNTTDPAGVRGRDIQIQLGDGAAAYTDWFGVQSVNIDWAVTLERDEEFDNPFVVAQDFDTPDVTGSVTMKPADVAALYSQIAQIADLTSTDIINATQDPAEVEFRAIIKDAAGVTTKTLQLDNVKWEMPALQGNVGQKLEADFTFTSADSVLNVFKGDQP